jgi:hypothetical protein
MTTSKQAQQKDGNEASLEQLRVALLSGNPILASSSPYLITNDEGRGDWLTSLGTPRCRESAIFPVEEGCHPDHTNSPA